MIKPDFDSWFEANEEELSIGFFEYLTESKHQDIYEFIFFFEGSSERVLANAKKAKAIYDSWLTAKFDEYCDESPEHDD